MATIRDNPYGAFNFLVAFGDAAGRRAAEHRGRLLRRLRPRQRGQLLRVPERQRESSTPSARSPTPSSSTTSHSSAGWSARPTSSPGSRRVRDGTDQPRTVTIMMLDEARNEVLSLVLRNAQPKKWIGPTLAAKGGGEVAMEELHLVHEGIEYE